MTIGKGSIIQTLTSGDVEQLLAEACEALPVDGKRVLVIIPDSTRTAHTSKGQEPMRKPAALKLRVSRSPWQLAFPKNAAGA